MGLYFRSSVQSGASAESRGVAYRVAGRTITPPVSIQGRFEEELILEARILAERVARIFPADFTRALPRGYTVSGCTLVILKVDTHPVGSHRHMYGGHMRWGFEESAAFLKDIRDGWLAELGAFMRWQLRDDAAESVKFQASLAALRASVG